MIARKLYRLWPSYRKGLVEFDGRKIFFPFIIVDVAMAAIFSLPFVVRATGIAPAVAVALIGGHLGCVYLASFPVNAAAQRSERAFHLQVAMALAYNVGICIALIAATHDPKTMLWMSLMIYAGVCGASQELEPTWLYLLTFLLTPLATIPWFIRTAGRGPWTIAGPVLASSLCAALYHALAISSSAWRQERARLALRIAELDRQQIRRDLHDGLGSSLTLLAICGDALEQALARPEQALPILRTLQQAARDGMLELRILMNGASAVETNLGSLHSSLEHLADSAAALTGTSVTVEVVGSREHLVSGEARVAITRIFQEALSNALRHGQPKTISARLAVDDATTSLDIHDDGRGFLPTQPSSGHGISGMRSRANDLGGTFELVSTPGAGTHLCVRIPRMALEPPARLSA